MALLDDGSQLVTGGVNGKRTLDDLFVCTPSALEAPLRQPAPWGPRRGHAAIALPRARCLILGGVDADGAPCQDVWLLASGHWLQLPDATWTPRSGMAACCAFLGEGNSADATVFVCGGTTATGEALADVWALDVADPAVGEAPGRPAWRCVTARAPFCGRSRHALAWAAATRQLVLAGGVSAEGRYMADVWTCAF